MFYRSYLLLILPAFSKQIVKWKENWKNNGQLILMLNGWLYGDGVWGGQNILPYMIIDPFREIWEYIREISGDSQGKKMCQSMGSQLAFPLVQFYGTGTVWSVLQSESHIYSNKTTCCQNNPAKSLVWMPLHQFQYLYRLKNNKWLQFK